MRHAIVVCLAAVCCSVPAFAQSASQPDLSEVLRRLDAVEHRVQDLELQNDALRAQLAATSPARTAPPAEVGTQTAVTKAAPGMDHGHSGGTAPESQETYPNLHFRGFA